MSNNYGLNKYKQTSVTTASRGQVLLMLYEGAIKFCRIAIDATQKKDLAEKGKYILKVQDIINELVVTLDHNVGGNLSKELERLYNYMIEQITEANIKNDVKPLQTTLKLLETLYEGWAAAVNQVNKQGGEAAAQAATAAAASAANATRPPGKTDPKGAK
ncbi:MAG: flagellar export chaperone FliS [Deltaproteobacteria bacterium]|nr:flagellar export chaperone FliS [Deltaproteobacteria bacterium]